METKYITASILQVILALTLLQTCLGQFTATPTSIVYVHIEPKGLGEVGYYLSGELLDEWPRITTPIKDFFLISFPQYTYAYFEAKPYGCAELEAWNITPPDVETIPTGDRSKLIIHLTKDYITVKAIFKSLPEDRCPYIPVFGGIRIEKNTLYTTLTIMGIVGGVGIVAYSTKRRIERRRREEMMYKQMIEERIRKALENTLGRDYLLPYYEPHVILWTAFAGPFLDEVGFDILRETLLNDTILRSYRYRQLTPRNPITDSYIAYAHENRLIMLGLKTYLALANIIPSSRKLIEAYVATWKPDWGRHDRDRMKHEILRMIKFLEVNKHHQREGLEKVLTLIKTDQRYSNRIKYPPEYYEAVLAVLDKWLKQEIGIDYLSKIYRIRPEMAEIPSEEEPKPRKPRWVLEEFKENYRVSGDEIELPEDLKPPEWLKKMFEIEEAEKEAEKKAEAEREAEIKKEAEKTVEKPVEKLPIEWDEVPRYIQKSIEGLKISFRELVEAASKIIDEKDVYREADKLIQKNYPDMDEESKTSLIFTLIDVLTYLKNMILEKKVEEERVEEIKEEGKTKIQREVEKTEERREEKTKLEEEVKKAGETWEATEPSEEAIPERLEEKEAGEIIGEEPKREEEKPRVEKVVKEEVEKVEEKVTEKVKVEVEESEKTYYKGVDGVLEIWKSKGFSNQKELHLIDVEAPWIPTCLLVEMYDKSEFKTIVLESKKHYGRKDLLDEIIEDVRKALLISMRVPVIIIGRPGYTEMRGKWKTAYIDRLKELLEAFKREGISRYGVVMPLQVYVKYCLDIPELKEMKKYVYVADFQKIYREVEKKIPENSIPYLRRVIALSSILEAILSKDGRPGQWKPPDIPDRVESQAIGWAVRTIISKAGPLTIEEIERAGYGEYVESLRVLGMVEEGGER